MNRTVSHDSRLRQWIFGLSVFALMAFAAPAAAQPSINVGTAFVNSGDIVELPVTFTNNGPVTFADVQLIHDQGLSLIGLTCDAGSFPPPFGGNGHNGTAIICSDQGGGFLHIVIDGGGNALFDSVFAVLTFDTSGMSPGDYPITVSSTFFEDDVQNQIPDFGSSDGNINISGGCNYFVPNPPDQFPEFGGQGSFTLDTQQGCDWTAVPDQGWINAVFPNSGNDFEASISFNVDQNFDQNPRSGIVEIFDGQGNPVAAHAINQDPAGGGSCTYFIPDPPLFIDEFGGSAVFTLDTQPGCDWTAVPDQGWINSVAPSAGNDFSVISFFVDQNLDPSSRAGIIEIFDGQGSPVAVHQINQDPAGGGGCSYSVSPPGSLFPSIGGGGSFQLNTGQGCGWNLAPNVPWVNVISSLSGTDSTTVQFDVDPSNENQFRSGLIEVFDDQGNPVTAHVVDQDPAGGGGCTYDVFPPASSFDENGGSGSFDVTTQPGCNFSLNPLDPWVSILGSNSSGLDTISVQFDVASNNGGARQTIIEVLDDQAIPVAAHLVDQAGVGGVDPGGNPFVVVGTGTGNPGDLVLIPVFVETDGATVTSFDFTLFADPGILLFSSVNCSLSVAGSCGPGPLPGEILFSAQPGGLGQVPTNVPFAEIELLIDPNAPPGLPVPIPVVQQNFFGPNGSIPPGAPADGFVFIDDNVGGGDCFYDIQPPQSDLPPEGGPAGFLVNAPPNCGWNLASEEFWINGLAPQQGSGTLNVDFFVDPNSDPVPRSGAILLFDDQGNLVNSHQVFQFADAIPGGPGPATIIGSGAGQPGDVISIPVDFLNNGQVADLEVDILFDSFRVDLVGFHCQLIAPFDCFEIADGILRISSAAGAVGGTIPPGPIAFLDFSVLPTVSPPDVIPLLIGFEQYNGPNGGIIAPNGSVSGVIEVFGTGGCDFQLDPTSDFFDVQGGNGQINVFAPQGCSWFAETSVPWINIAGSDGAGDGVVTYSVSSNANGAPRTGTIFVAGQLFTVVQDGAAGQGPAIQVGFANASPGEEVLLPLDFINNGNVNSLQADVVFDPGRLSLALVDCFFLSPTASCFEIAPGVVQFNIQEPSGAPLPSGPMAILILQVQPGLGQQTIPVNVAGEFYTSANGQSIPPNGTSNGGVSVSGFGGCEYFIDPPSSAFPQAGGPGAVLVQASDDCGWSAASDVPWIQVDQNFTGQGSGSVNFTVDANKDGFPRTGSVVVAGQIHIVSQSGGDAGGVPAILIGSTVGVPGGLATVPLTFVNDGSVSQFVVDVQGDPGFLSVASFDCGSSGLPINCQQSGPSSVTFDALPANLGGLPSGVFGSITFAVDPAAPIPIDLPVFPGFEDYLDANGNSVPPGGSSPGVVSIVENNLSDESFDLKEDEFLEGFVGSGNPATPNQFIQLFSPPSNGFVELAPDGFFFYQPEPDFFGQDSFVYIQGDPAGGALGGQARVILNVNAVPDVNPDIFTVLEGQTLSGNVASNDDRGDEPATVSLEIDAANGDLNLAADGSFTYEPDGPGTDTFLYQLLDADGDFGEPGQVTITTVANPNAGNVVQINANQSLDEQIDGAIRMANGQNTAVRVRFPSGTYSYQGGVANGSHGEPVNGTVIFEPTAIGAPVTIQGTGGGRWLDVAGGSVTINSLTVENFASSANGGIVLTRGGGSLQITGAWLRNSTASGSGGAIHARTGSQIRIQPSALGGSRFSGNSAGDGGGAIHLESGSTLFMADTSLTDNQAGNRGGALRLRDANNNTDCGGIRCPLVAEIVNTEFERNSAASGGAMDILIQGGDGTDSIRIDNVIFGDNSVTNRGCDVRHEDQRDPLDTGVTVFSHSTFFGTCPSERIYSEAGGMTVLDSTLVHDGNAIVTNGQVDLSGNILTESSLVAKNGGKSARAKTQGQKSTCESSVGIFNSLGFNLSTDDSCDLSKATDQPNTNPMLTRSGKDFTLLGGSPIIDAAAAEMIAVLAGASKELPCGYKDVNGLGRPQDGDGDGGYECDIGNVEAKNGPDIQGAQSSAYFDPERPGEGVFVEVLEGGLIFSAMFTYQPDGSGPAWMVGVGQANGNTMVMDEMLLTSGGVFGEAFDPNLVVRTPMGGMSLVFSECNSEAKPGRLAFQASTGSPFADTLIQMARLSNIVSCGATTPAAKSGRSGSFFDPARDGEGIFVQWLEDGRVVLIWYTFDPDGNQFWTISGETTDEGGMVTANMLYPATSTSFGLGFNAEDIVLENWGTVTLEYSNCNTMTFSYDSVVDGFGSGTYTYQRLTTLKDTSCDLE